MDKKLENEMTLFDVAYRSCTKDFKNKIKELPTHSYREYDGHNEVVVKECVYVSDLMRLFE